MPHFSTAARKVNPGDVGVVVTRHENQRYLRSVFEHTSAFVFWSVHCKSGVIVRGCIPDFLAAIYIARQQRDRFQRELPHSRFRVQLRYPNNRRVPLADIRAALAALADHTVLALVAERVEALSAAPYHLRAAGVVGGPESAFFSRQFGGGFSQAGVVAPPESPDLGTAPVSPGCSSRC